TYRELNERANRLARILRNKGVKPNSITGIMVERSLEMTVGILGILKAGGAYLPIDPSYPKERIEYMLKDSESKVLLFSKGNFKDSIEFQEGAIDISNEELFKGDSSNLEVVNSSRDLAYVIYTSGSTGKPKGVMIEHHSVINRINWMQSRYPLSSTDVILQKTPFTFDVSVWELFWWFFAGARVCVLIPGGEKDPEAIVSAIERNEVTTMHFVPSMLSAFLNYVDGNIETKRLSSLRQVFASGEALRLHQVEAFNSLLWNTNGTRLTNLYGPTEATVDVSYFDCSIGHELANVPIGKPIDNTELYVVNQHNQLMPVGVPGELCIAGVGLARGYLNRKELTAEKFVDNPFKPGERMYRTGDLARWLSDGNIEFLGRIDHQVKIRGYRIELGEIENVLKKQIGVKDTVVLDREDADGNKYLCGYIVKELDVSIEGIKAGARAELPEYMVPNIMVEIDEIPLTANGKIDRKVLLNIEVVPSKSNEYEAPRNDIEGKLVRMWEDILGIDRVGIHDNFFELGGHSLKATVLSGRIRKELEVEVGIGNIFENPTIIGLAEYILQGQKTQYELLKPLDKSESYAVSSAQRRMYVVQMMDSTSTAYNMPMALELTGNVDRERIERAIEALINKHEALRTSFHMEGEEIVQRIHEKGERKLQYIEVEEEEKAEEIMKGWIKPFELDKYPIMRGGIIKTGEKFLLMLDMHHIVSDGVTMNILAEDFVKAYEGEELSIEAVQYKEYAQWEKEQKENGVWEKQKEYWKEVYKGEVPVLELPMEGIRGKIGDTEGERISFEIGEGTVESLKEAVKAVGGTLYMGLMAGFSILLSKYSGQEDIVIGSPIAGRRHTQLENIAGMFVNTLAIKTNPEGEKSVKAFLAEMKQILLGAYENQEFPYEELVEVLEVERDLSRNPLFDVMLVLQNMEMK
ncbi:non-ribosomal peptide synthetase, partial [Bacillus thuringiensis]|uniref:non-ribosomal peptide synthetase n=1 Tax=Bacillus thuringiensis TaxID=1428 RepID=UPI000BED1B1F